MTKHQGQIGFSQRRWWASEQAISYLMQQGVENPDVISLAAGLVDQQTLPVAETRSAVEKLLADEDCARLALQYGTTPGSARLRGLLLEHLARLEALTPHPSPSWSRPPDGTSNAPPRQERIPGPAGPSGPTQSPAGGEGLGIDPEQLILTTGSHQLLSLASEALLDPGDICLVAAPTYFVFLGTLAGLGARSVPVPADEDGMRTDALEATLEQLKRQGELHRVKLIYVVSYYENPSGASLSADRRRNVVEIARRWSNEQRIYILEDAAYRELHYDGPVLPSVWSCDSDTEHVVLAQTFSKSFSPGLRVGYGIVPETLVGPVCDLKGNEDFGSANFNQHLLATVLDEGLYEPHVRQLCDSYRTKRDCMLAAAEEHFADLPGVRWIRPHGGLYVWMTLPESIDTGFDGPLFEQATNVYKVMYVPGDLFFAGGVKDRPRNHLRLSFGVQSLEGIRRGMDRLAQAVRAVL